MPRGSGRPGVTFTKSAAVSTKISLRIEFENYQPPHHREVAALRSTRSAESVSRSKLAATIAQETLCYVGAVRQIYVGGRTYSFEQVFLVQLQHMSKGSWQLVFYVCT